MADAKEQVDLIKNASTFRLLVDPSKKDIVSRILRKSGVRNDESAPTTPDLTEGSELLSLLAAKPFSL